MIKLKKYTISVLKLLFDKKYRWIILANRGFYNGMSDESFLKKKYFYEMRKVLNLDNPKSFNEKLQWLKLNNRNSQFTTMVDKYEVRRLVSEKIGEEYLIPLIGVWDEPCEIEFDKLPNQFVLKCNHNSGLGMLICKDKSKLNKKKTTKNLKKGLKQNYYLSGREWPYKDVKRRVICEKFLVDDDDKSGSGLTDYKFFCFNGVVDCVMVCVDRELDSPKYYFFDRNWNLLRLNIRGKNAPEDFSLPRPSQLDEMFKIAKKLSKGLIFSRIDLYECNKQVYFGEITFFPDSGFDSNILEETDYYFGSKIKLPIEEE